MEIDYGSDFENELLNYLRYNGISQSIISQVKAIFESPTNSKQEILRILRRKGINNIIILNVEDIIFKHTEG